MDVTMDQHTRCKPAATAHQKPLRTTAHHGTPQYDLMIVMMPMMMRLLTRTRLSILLMMNDDADQMMRSPADSVCEACDRQPHRSAPNRKEEQKLGRSFILPHAPFDPQSHLKGQVKSKEEVGK